MKKRIVTILRFILLWFLKICFFALIILFVFLVFWAIYDTHEIKQDITYAKTGQKIKISGYPSCVAETRLAMDLLSTKTNYTAYVFDNLGAVKFQPNSGYVDVQTNPTVFHESLASCYNLPAYELAASMVHEATHVSLYRQGQNYSGTEAEQTCIVKQIDALTQLGAPQSVIDWYKQADGTHWVQPVENRNFR